MKRLQATLIVSRPHRGVLFTCPGDLSPFSCWRSDGIVYRGQWSRADGYYTLQDAAPDGVNKEVFANWAGMAIDQCADSLAAYSDMDTGQIPSGARAVIDDDGNVLFIVSMVAGDLDGNLPAGLEWESQKPEHKAEMVVEVLGGCVVSARSKTPDSLSITLIDYDNIAHDVIIPSEYKSVDVTDYPQEWERVR